MATGWLYDGIDARRRPAAITAVDGAIVVETGDSKEAIDPALLTFVDDQGDAWVFGRSDRDGWRLGLTPIDPALAALLPRRLRYGAWIDRIGLLRASLAGIAISAVVGFAAYMLPHWAAPYVPDSIMKQYGDALVGDFGGKFCAGPGGQSALDRLTRRLAPGARGLNVRVVNIPIVNAAALPGGNIVVFNELLKEAKSPEEFAGVLGHEIAHVEHRDVAEAMVRELGVGLVVSTLGGNVGGNAHRLLALSYSRDAEARADAGSIAAMQRADISPALTAEFFDRLSKDEDASEPGTEVFVYLSTHPDTRKRAASFREAAGQKTYQPAMTRDEWDALVDICHNDPKQQSQDADDLADELRERIEDAVEGGR